MTLFKAVEYICRTSIVYIRDAFYVSGGLTHISNFNKNWQTTTTIGKLDVNLIWSKVGDLNKRRHGHNVIFDGNYALVIGGYTDNDVLLPTEKCRVSTNGVICTEQSPSLYRYLNYPELFMVPWNFCK